MAKIPRKTQKIFAGSATNNGQFGSAQAGTKVISTNLATLQALGAYDTGWLDAVIGTKKFPTLEEFQALNYIETTQLSYLFQEGIPEWDTGTNYFQKSIVKKTGTYQIYGSLTDDNQGNALTDGTKWVLLQDLSAPAISSDIGMIKDFAGTSAPTGFLACNGAAISRTTYAALFAAIGTTWGVGNGTTTFNIPASARRVRVGSGGSGTATLGNAVGDTGGEEAHAQSLSEMAAHSHLTKIASGSAASDTYPSIDAATSTTTNSTSPGTDTQGSGAAANIMQPSGVYLQCIQYQ